METSESPVAEVSEKPTLESISPPRLRGEEQVVPQTQAEKNAANLARAEQIREEKRDKQAADKGMVEYYKKLEAERARRDKRREERYQRRSGRR